MRGIFSRSRAPRAGDRVSTCRSALLLAIVLLSAGISCRRAPEDPVRGSLDRLAAAARDRDSGAVMDLVSADFRAGDGMGRSEIEGTLRRLFAAYEKLDVTLADVRIERSENAALARFRADVSGSARKIGGLDGLLPATSSWRFEARMAPENGRWKITWASWSPAP